jgi:hypothetical protein
MLDDSAQGAQTRKPEIYFRPAFSTSAIAGSAFKSAGTFDIKFVPNNVVGAFLSRSILLAYIAGTAWSDKTQARQ